MYRSTFVEIDNNKLKNNVKEIIKKYHKYKYYIGVVKANAYGHGDYIVNDLIASGINYLAVSSLEEAISIRKYNKEILILCLEPINIKYLKEVILNNVTITITSINYVKELIRKENLDKLKVHLKLDTGMNRLGIKSKEEVTEIVTLLNDNNIYIEGIYTHFATSGVNDTYYEKQLNNFQYLTSDIDLNKIEIIHLDRSITLVHHDKIPFATGVRLGIIMYGFNQSIKPPTGIRKVKRDILNRINKVKPSILENDLKLSTALTLYTEVMEIKKVTKGEKIGYGSSFIAKKDMVVAVLPIGYVDKNLPFVKYVYINNKKYPVVGEICMDMVMIEIDVTIKVGDKVELFGDHIKIKEISRDLNTSAYHILTSVGVRVPRVYKDGVEINYGNSL